MLKDCNPTIHTYACYVNISISVFILKGSFVIIKENSNSAGKLPLNFAVAILYI